MSKSLFVFLLVVAAAGYYFYKTNQFKKVNASFDFSPNTISVTALDDNLHDCKLRLTHDFTVELPVLRTRTRVTIAKTDFKQWNGTILEKMSDLGPQVEFKLRCKEGSAEDKKPNRYEKEEKKSDTFKPHEEEVDRR